MLGQNGQGLLFQPGPSLNVGCPARVWPWAQSWAAGDFPEGAGIEGWLPRSLTGSLGGDPRGSVPPMWFLKSYALVKAGSPRPPPPRHPPNQCPSEGLSSSQGGSRVPTGTVSVPRSPALPWSSGCGKEAAVTSS